MHKAERGKRAKLGGARRVDETMQGEVKRLDKTKRGRIGCCGKTRERRVSVIKFHAELQNFSNEMKFRAGLRILVAG